MAWLDAEIVFQYLNHSQTNRVEVVKRVDGLAFFVEHTLEIEDRPYDFEKISYWRETYRSGLYQSVEDVRREVFASVVWMKTK